jgi:cystathionine beta-lyase/cystathionine gamma-synthase
VALPIERSSTFVASEQAYLDRLAGDPYSLPVYAREAAPTVLSVERRLAALEGSEDALLWASGMAALHGALMAELDGGKRMAVALQSYGGSLSLVRSLAPRLGIEVEYFDVTRPESLDSIVARGVDLVLCESLSNPTLKVADLPALAERTHAGGGRLLVDATFVTPLGQRPLEWGADLVWHSASKYLGGHSDLIGGVLSGSRQDLRAARDWRTSAGGCADPEMAWLVERGLKTLGLRMERHSENAEALAAHLATHPAVARVHHPSVGDPEQRALAERLLECTGGMLSFECVGGDEAAARVLAALELFVEAPSLGGVESLVSPPARMSHAGLDEAALREVDIGPGCIRVSVGIEDACDLIADLDRALASA